MKKCVLLICSLLPAQMFGQHMVFDAQSYVTEMSELLKETEIVQNGIQHLAELRNVFGQLKDLYSVVGEVKRLKDMCSENLFDNFVNNFVGDFDFNGLSINDANGLENLINTSDRRLGCWGVQPATTGVLGDMMTRMTAASNTSRKISSEVSSLPYTCSRDNVLYSLFRQTSYKKNTGGLFSKLFSKDSVEVKEKEDDLFAMTESGIKAKSVDGSLTEPTISDKLILTDKAQAKVEADFHAYVQSQTIATQLKATQVNDILSNKDGAYTNDIAGLTKKSVDLTALEVASISDVTDAVNQNTATNIRLNEVMQEKQRIEREAKDAAHYSDLLD